ncbi:MAG: hypothetical protein WBH84_07475 [Defluviitoga tunisiensis]|jgi:hypothetical protein|uniref:Uncharacterized protein n=1 Tax=Defluviitoga tunisiensis TaxID=1006576 RepID=A0A0C7NN87_DEFTU|nr:hypothetical protein [Defluviitoga tunisiensis]MDD3600769.1 hypothetical protein [Defluviitoga tunisiensis]MDY0379174.1 hypothetical protein [Defluviitoga tunisiensis]CEP77382.1 hypothetical protein DTL3_0048 [Defluviitoga tunisiensis]HHV01633.1 hypothetical protein [Defluviitoga tunisiensis]HOB55605.1 hypothetical protein [Defluviitoga tunisiensis]
MEDFGDKEFKDFLNKMYEQYPELQNFNLDFLKEANSSEAEELVNVLRLASFKFKKAEITVKPEVESQLDYNIDDLEVNLDNFLETITMFPFALTVSSDLLKDTENEIKGSLRGKFLGMYVNLKYNNIYELLSIKKVGAMKLANLLRNNFFKFLPLKESLNSYIKTVIEAYLKYTDLAKYLEIEEIREFNMVVKLKNIFDVSQDDFFDNVLTKEEADKYYMMKAYLISEFAIAIVE